MGEILRIQDHTQILRNNLIVLLYPRRERGDGWRKRSHTDQCYHRKDESDLHDAQPNRHHVWIEYLENGGWQGQCEGEGYLTVFKT